MMRAASFLFGGNIYIKKELKELIGIIKIIYLVYR
jgi:hypothetical protein